MPRSASLLLAVLFSLPALAGTVTAARQQELVHLLYQDCGSCHGMRLTGGLGPALTPAALAGKSRQLLLDTIRLGRSGTPMPPWGQLLPDDDIAWLVDYLMQAEPAP